MIKFTCEVGSNHNGDIERARAFIACAKDAGFDAVKFQALPETPSGLWRDGRDVPWAYLDLYDLQTLSWHAKEIGLEFSCSVFNIKDIQPLNCFVNSFKIGSYEILCHDMIRACAETGKPLALSFGNCVRREWENAIGFANLGAYYGDLTLYHCVSDYPTKLEDCCMPKIEEINEWANYCIPVGEKGRKLGWSDHTRNPLAIFAAVGMGATAIELHVDLDGTGAEFAHGHCWLPDECKRLIANVREMEKCFSGGQDENCKMNRVNRCMRTDPKDYKRGLLKGEGQ